MKVIHMISGDLWAGAEAQAFTLLSHLNKIANLELAVIVLNEGLLAIKLRELAISVYVLDESKTSAIDITNKVRRILVSERADILHTHRYKENVLGALASRWAGKPRLVKTVHGLTETFSPFNHLKASLYGLLDRAISRLLFDRIICVSNHTLQAVSKHYHQDQLICIRNGIDVEVTHASTNRADVRARLDIDLSAQVIGYAGRLVGIKGLEYFLEAISIVRSTIPDACAVLIGDGPEMNRLRTLAATLGIEDLVNFVGHRSDIYDLVGAMDVFVLPSLSEGTPMVLLEAMSLGTPIVATQVGGVPEILTHGVTGLLVTPGDAQQLATAIADVLTHKDKAQRQAAIAREAVQRNLSAQSMAEATKTLYKSIL